MLRREEREEGEVGKKQRERKCETVSHTERERVCV